MNRKWFLIGFIAGVIAWVVTIETALFLEEELNF
jgi:hypothetical protein